MVGQNCLIPGQCLRSGYTNGTAGKQVSKVYIAQAGPPHYCKGVKSPRLLHDTPVSRQVPKDPCSQGPGIHYLLLIHVILYGYTSKNSHLETIIDLYFIQHTHTQTHAYTHTCTSTHTHTHTKNMLVSLI